jgi:hypothetical protein
VFLSGTETKSICNCLVVDEKAGATIVAPARNFASVESCLAAATTPERQSGDSKSRQERRGGLWYDRDATIRRIPDETECTRVERCKRTLRS